MNITYIGRRPREVAPTDGRPFAVQPGQTFEVDDQLGESLLAQPRRYRRATPPPDDEGPKRKEARKQTGKRKAPADNEEQD